MAKGPKLVYTNVSTEFSDPKLRKAYAELRKAFDQAAKVRDEVVNPAKEKFDAMLKTHLVKSGEAESEEYLKIGHQYGLAFAVLDEPEVPAEKKQKKRIVSV